MNGAGFSPHVPTRRSATANRQCSRPPRPASSPGGEPHCLAILAAACSEAADFEGAIRWQGKALDLLPTKSPDKREYLGLLERYKARKPYHRLGLLEEMGVPIPHQGAK